MKKLILSLLFIALICLAPLTAFSTTLEVIDEIAIIAPNHLDLYNLMNLLKTGDPATIDLAINNYQNKIKVLKKGDTVFWYNDAGHEMLGVREKGSMTVYYGMESAFRVVEDKEVKPSTIMEVKVPFAFIATESVIFTVLYALQCSNDQRRTEGHLNMYLPTGKLKVLRAGDKVEYLSTEGIVGYTADKLIKVKISGDAKEYYSTLSYFQ